MKAAISLGGDTDTIAAMTGAIAGATSLVEEILAHEAGVERVGNRVNTLAA